MRCHKLIVCALSLACVAFGQAHNYTQGDIDEGAKLYRANCIGCHGPEGTSVAGTDFTHGIFRRVSTDDDIANAILNGIPGTGMPPGVTLTGSRAHMIVGYVRSMNSPVKKSIAAASGDAVRGKALFAGKAGCVSCHAIRGEGGRSAPDLGDAGLAYRAIEIESSILDPDAEYSLTSRPFRVVKKNGTVIMGSLMNQDTFSIQMTDQNGALQSVLRRDVKEAGVQKSPMPSYRGKLDAQELADVIEYVHSQRSAK